MKNAGWQNTPSEMTEAERWKHDDMRVMKGDRLDPNTAQTPGALLSASTSAPRQARDRDSPGQPSLLDLVFRPIHQFRTFDPLPSKFLQIQEQFEGTTLSHSMKCYQKEIRPG